MNLGLNLALGNQRNASGEPPLTPQQHLLALLTGIAEAGVYDFRTATDNGALEVVNMAGNLGSQRQPTLANKPAIVPGTGLAFDGTNDRVSVAAVGAYTVDLLLRKTGGSVTGHIISALRLYTQDSLIGINGTTVDGVATTTRDALFTAMDDAAWHHVRFNGLTLTGTLALGNAINGMAGTVMLVVAIPEAAFGSAQLSAARAASSAWIASQRP